MAPRKVYQGIGGQEYTKTAKPIQRHEENKVQKPLVRVLRQIENYTGLLTFFHVPNQLMRWPNLRKIFGGLGVRADKSFFIEYPKAYFAKVMKRAFINNFIRRGKVADNSQSYEEWMVGDTPNQDITAIIMDASKYLSDLDLYEKATIKKTIYGHSALEISGNGYKTGISVVRRTINNFRNELKAA